MKYFYLLVAALVEKFLQGLLWEGTFPDMKILRLKVGTYIIIRLIILVRICVKWLNSLQVFKAVPLDKRLFSDHMFPVLQKCWQTFLLAAGSGELGGREAGDAAGCAGHLRQLSTRQGGRRGRGHHPSPHRQKPGRGQTSAGLLQTSLQLFKRFLNWNKCNNLLKPCQQLESRICPLLWSWEGKWEGVGP